MIVDYEIKSMFDCLDRFHKEIGYPYKTTEEVCLCIEAVRFYFVDFD